ncbi:MAG: polysaccharide biosynthesis C-terminal domain-containing protein [Spirochaetes bacterium]|uniref:Polysaccharide biosynthesis C-terminal domain-containing protein n=1 Tax=Candidatus Ornithospirochaeta stercoravium TaxID=2840897 RepID=A0A9D9IA40_9SPIO|nr:polysaccharide biosynthesis C-terminal domain-containing protein [Candidatus Ornithospirochaeta stercoravium]
MLSFIHSNLLRSEGLSKESMIGTAGGAIVNIILDPIMISGLGWGASGAAIATVIGYIFSDAVFLVMVKRKSRILGLSLFVVGKNICL